MTDGTTLQGFSFLLAKVGFTVMSCTMAFSPFAAYAGDGEFRITVVYNNVGCSDEVKQSWGFSCVVQTSNETLLFDTGGDGAILLKNMEKLGIAPQEIEAVFLSHNHRDHTGGLLDFLRQNSNVAVYVPRSFSSVLNEKIKNQHTRIISIGDATRLYENFYTTGEMESWVIEQSLVVDTPKGIVVITGCAHPGIVNIVRRAKQLIQKDVCLVMGGFHLLDQNASQIEQVILALEEMGVEKIAPSHCTGEDAMSQFKRSWRKNFISGGCGAHLRP
jgi:7,8-dihydropterin-6-yl-methyl-4-(beta-D-ribofuranosyl)aminobenzene 5'-phosphate synthase